MDVASSSVSGEDREAGKVWGVSGACSSWIVVDAVVSAAADDEVSSVSSCVDVSSSMGKGEAGGLGDVGQ